MGTSATIFRVILCCAFAVPVYGGPKQCTVLARTGPSPTLSQLSPPSINDNGWVAFQATTVNTTNASVHNLYAVNIADLTIHQLMNDVFEYPPTGAVPRQEIDPQVTVNNLDEVLAWRFLTARVNFVGTDQDLPLTYLEYWPVSGTNSSGQHGVPDQQVVMGDSGTSAAPQLVFFLNPVTASTYPTPFRPVGFSAVYRPAATNSLGQVAFSALQGSTRNRVTWPHTNPEYQGGGISFDYYPVMSAAGGVVFSSGLTLRYEPFDFSSLLTIAGSGNGFSSVGLHPGISDDDKVIAFTGVHSSMGPGVYIVYRIPSGFSTPLKVAGIGDGIIDPNELWYDPDGSTGPAARVEIPRLNAISINSSVGVNKTKSAVAGAEYNVIFIATDAAGLQTLQHARVDLTAVPPVVGRAASIVTQNDSVPNFGTIDSMQLNDPLPQNMTAAFWAQTNTGTQAVLKSALKPVVHYFGVGVQWADGMRGDQTVANMERVLKANLESFVRSTYIQVDASAPSILNTVRAVFDSFVQQVSTEDTIIIHFASHGGTFDPGPEAPFLTLEPNAPPVMKTGDEYVSLSTQEKLLDDEFVGANFLNHPKLAGVRKVLILDFCRSGGFIPDIASAHIGNVAVFAACNEGGWAVFNGNGHVFSNAIASAFTTGPDGFLQGDLNKDRDMTAAEIAKMIINLQASADLKYYNIYGDPVSYQNLIGQSLNLADAASELYGQQAVFGGQSPQLFLSEDFSSSVSGNPFLRADLNRDGLVDGQDLAAFIGCGTRSGVSYLTQPPPSCGLPQDELGVIGADFDRDGDVDCDDFGVWQRLYKPTITGN